MTRPPRRLLAIAGVVVIVALGSSVPPSFAQADSPAPTTTSTPAAPTTAPRVDDPFGGWSTTTLPPPGGDDTGTIADDRPGFFDFAGKVRRAVNGWFRGLVEDALEPVLNLVGRTILSTPDFTGPGRVRDLWLVSWGIANGIFVLFILAAGVIGMGYESLQSRYAVKELLPRLALAFVGANTSLFLAHLAIGMANALSQAFMGEGVSGDGAVATMRTLVVAAMAGGGIFVTLIAIVVVVLALGLVGVYVVRVCTMVVLVGAAPLFLAAHALPQTEGAARLWWRAIFGCLGVQVGQALVLITAVRVFFDADGRRSMGLPGGPLMDLLVVGCLFWLLLRIPSYAGRLVFNTRPNVALTVARHYTISRGLHAARTAAAAAAL